MPTNFNFNSVLVEAANAYLNGTGFSNGLTFTGGSITGSGATVVDSTPVLNLSQTWNDGTETFTGLKFNVTDTASASASALIDLRVNNVSLFSVNKSGSVFSANTVNAASDVGLFRLGASFDVILARDSANILAQRNGTNAQSLRVYNTFTDDLNYERLEVGTNVGGLGANTFGITATAAGTGTLRDIYMRGSRVLLQTGGANNRWLVDTTGHVLAVTDNAYDIGASSANRPRNGYFAGTLTSGSHVKTGVTTVAALPAAATAGAGARYFVSDSTTNAYGGIVAGGGSSPVPVYSDGSNWRIG